MKTVGSCMVAAVVVAVLAGCGKREQPAPVPAPPAKPATTAVTEAVEGVQAEIRAGTEKVAQAAAQTQEEMHAAMDAAAEKAEGAGAEALEALNAAIEQALAAKDYKTALAKVEEALKLPDLAVDQKNALTAKLAEIKKLLVGDAAADAAAPAQEAAAEAAETTKAAATEATKTLGGLLKQ